MTTARDKLLDAALARFDRDGAVAATLEEIRADAGVSVGALYHHFKDKQALASTLYVETLAGFQQGFLDVLGRSPTAELGIRATVGHTVGWGAAHPAQARLLFGGRGSADPEALAEINRDFFGRTSAWYATHAFYGAVRELPFTLLASLWLGPSLEYLRHTAGGAPGEPDPVARAALADAAWAALGTASEKEFVNP